MTSNDPSQTDLAWRGYSGWAMLPSFTVCALLSVALLTGSWFFEEIEAVSRRVGSLIFFAVTLVIWLGQLLRWLYRGAMYVYRLTPKFLYVDRGFLYNPEPAVELAKVLSVTWGGNRLNRLFGVGWVVLEVEWRVPLTLTGILQPAAFAEEIEAAVKKVRHASSGFSN